MNRNTTLLLYSCQAALAPGINVDHLYHRCLPGLQNVYLFLIAQVAAVAVTCRQAAQQLCRQPCVTAVAGQLLRCFGWPGPCACHIPGTPAQHSSAAPRRAAAAAWGIAQVRWLDCCGCCCCWLIIVGVPTTVFPMSSAAAQVLPANARLCLICAFVDLHVHCSVQAMLCR
jgi:hypothetical protein